MRAGEESYGPGEKMRPAAKIVLNTAGTACVVLGVLGVVLPLLPATPFLLLASACYVRGSERLHRRLVSHRLLGPYIEAFRGRRGMPARAKVYTLLLLWPSLLFSAHRAESFMLAALLLAVGAAVSALVLSLRAPAAADE
jgi:uncharacterized protein